MIGVLEPVDKLTLNLLAIAEVELQQAAQVG
jgi:hypothetical protein